MPTFAQYMAELAQRRGIRRMEDGGRVTYRLRMSDGASLTVVTDELDVSQVCRVTSEAWPVPVTASAHATFLREALAFNRSALAHLPCGIVQDPAQSSLYRLTWCVPDLTAQEQEWRQRFKLFAALATKAWSTLPQPGQSAASRRPASDEQHVIFMP